MFRYSRLEGLEAVRKKTGYVHRLNRPKRITSPGVFEILDNSINESVDGYCDSIPATIHKNNSVTSLDNGRGIPVDIHPMAGIPA